MNREFYRWTVDFDGQSPSDRKELFTMKITSREMLRTLLVAAAAAPLSACAPAALKNAPAEYTKGLKMASLSQIPAEVKNLPVNVQQAYQFAVANPAVLKQIPCYCGCGGIGHTSNYSCY